jgi:hypothetical protein
VTNIAAIADTSTSTSHKRGQLRHFPERQPDPHRPEHGLQPVEKRDSQRCHQTRADGQQNQSETALNDAKQCQFDDHLA